MIRKVLTLWIVCTVYFYSFAQDSKVTTGVIAYQQQDYEKAISSLDEALKDPTLLKESNVPKAYYFRGNSLFQLYQKAAKEGNEVILEKYNDALLRAYDDFQVARKSDIGEWNAKAFSQLTILRPSLLQVGLGMLNYSYQQNISENDKSKALQTAEDYLKKTLEIDDEDYMPHDLLAQVYYQKEEYQKALPHFLDAKNYYQSDLPQRPDFLIAYVYYRLATIYRYYQHDQNDPNATASPEDLEKALQTIQEGKRVLQIEYQRFSKTRVGYSGAQVQRLEQQYQNVKNDLSKFELDLFLVMPDKYQEAVEKFKMAVEKEPGNYTIHVAYAQLLEVTDAEAAIAAYQKAIAVDASQTIAHFNIGAIYVNRAAELSRVANQQSNLDEAEVYNQQSLESLRKAKPHMENALETAPEELAIVNALMNICINLDEMEDYEKYREMKKQIQGN